MGTTDAGPNPRSGRETTPLSNLTLETPATGRFSRRARQPPREIKPRRPPGHRSIVLAVASLLAAFAAIADDRRSPASDGKDNLSPEARTAFVQRFELTNWPLIADPAEADKGCLPCHRDDQSNSSPPILSAPPDRLFANLLAAGYFDRSSPSSILTRVASKRDEPRMPPVPARAWSRAEVDLLRSFVRDLNDRRIRH